MTTQPPLLSVLIHGPMDEALLAKAIESVNTQNIAHLELIIGDNIAAAQGKYIAFLATTDLFEPGTLKTRLNYLLSNPDTDLIHSPVKLIDLDGNDLGAVITRPKAITFDAAINPIHLSGVMGKTKLFRDLSFSQDPALDWYQGWLLFTQVLSTGVTSEYVEEGGAQHRVWNTPTLDLELQQHQAALDVVLGWIYTPTHAAAAIAGFRQPPFTVAKRLREFSLFIWCLISGNTHVCKTMMNSTGFVAFLNTWLVKSVNTEIRFQVARHYHINLITQADALTKDIRHNILGNAVSLGLKETAPSIMLAICESFSAPYPQDHPTSTDHVTPLNKAPSPPQEQRPFVLITTFRTNGDADDIKNCAEILLENCNVPNINHVHVLLEGPIATLENLLHASQIKTFRSFIAQGKLLISQITSRPYYNTLFEYANSLGHVSAAIVNADMLLPEQAVNDLREGLTANEAPIYALTRWNQTATGQYLQSLQPHPPWSPWSPEGRCHFERNYLSYDCYIFKTPISVPAPLSSVLIGTLGCDTAIAALLRIEGYSVNNPCLSIRTLHKDEKLRDYADQNGQQHFKNNIAAVATALFSKYAQHPAYGKSLNNLHTLNRKVAWIGGPSSTKLIHTLFFNLGASPWVKYNAATPFSTMTIRITNGDLETAAESLSSIPEAIKNDIFIMWELSGFGPEGGHIADLLIKHDRFEALGYPLFGYQRQAIIHRDIACNSAQHIIDSLCQMLTELISESASGAH